MSRFIVLLALLATLRVSPAWADPLTCSTVPDNMAVASVYLAHVQQLIAQSPTLRRQCAVIASTPEVTVVIRAAMRMSPGRRAYTEFMRTGRGELRAVVDLPVSRDFAELLAHELEHVVEQIEGIDLAKRAARGDRGVWATGPNSYETVRATRIGRHVAREVRRCADPFSSSCEQAPVLLAATD
jgi:hypothetical protein